MAKFKIANLKFGLHFDCPQDNEPKFRFCHTIIQAKESNVLKLNLKARYKIETKCLAGPTQEKSSTKIRKIDEFKI